jgi:RNA polymerase sigma factor (sigma-70 family)
VTHRARNAELEQFIRQQHEVLVRTIASWVHSRADADDIAQQAYVRILQMSPPGLVAYLRAYLYQTARNLATDWIRRRRVREAYADEASLRSSPEDRRSPEHIVLAREDLDIVHAALARLPPQCHRALTLTEEDGLSYEEAGHRLGVKPGSAHRLVTRARRYLLDTLSA